MQQGFVKVAAVTPDIQVADPFYNRESVLKGIKKAAGEGAVVIVCPELCLTGYTCNDLFLQELLLREAKEALVWLMEQTVELNALIFVGLPFEHLGKLYNVAAAINRGRLLGLVPKTHLPNYGEFYEKRHFSRGMPEPVPVSVTTDVSAYMGTRMIFTCKEYPTLRVAAEICEDLWAPDPPSTYHALAGANLIVNLSASDETTGKDIYRRELVKGQSARLLCGYVYCSAGEGESTQDIVFSGHNVIAENGTLLAQATRFANEITYAQVDVERMSAERRRMTTFESRGQMDYCYQEFSLDVKETELTRYVDPTPFVPSDMYDREKRCEEILAIQSMGLKKRLAHTGCQSAVVGISGGLDSTLALLVTVRAFDALGIPREKITAVTMPGFGTTDRTYDNAVGMIRCLGTTFREISIVDAVNLHFQDIGHDVSVHDVTYENCQARERTQILMDIANKSGGMVIGTGDMSELALGWATYNGDHMSMYAVNCSVPKTLVRHLVRYYADTCGDARLADVLYDVLDTPVSPELLPPEDGKISQKTEDLVGPYELHDFYLYQVLRFGFSPAKVYRLAKRAFAGSYDDETILKWLKKFYWRFFSQQFKRSCIPDGPKVGTIALSPRGDLRMPSDASVNVWMRELETL
ncbi:MAG: NAD(+) synthase [bacterium]|nr:NAD(+) synthase [bacterium]MDY4099798.1 NAD(+) synthase [Lachnospiraceae bacterium]